MCTDIWGVGGAGGGLNLGGFLATAMVGVFPMLLDRNVKDSSDALLNARVTQ